MWHFCEAIFFYVLLNFQLLNIAEQIFRNIFEKNVAVTNINKTNHFLALKYYIKSLYKYVSSVQVTIFIASTNQSNLHT